MTQNTDLISITTHLTLQGAFLKVTNVSLPVIHKSDKSLFICNVKNQLKPDVTIKQIMISHFQINFWFLSQFVIWSFTTRYMCKLKKTTTAFFFLLSKLSKSVCCVSSPSSNFSSLLLAVK